MTVRSRANRNFPVKAGVETGQCSGTAVAKVWACGRHSFYAFHLRQFESLKRSNSNAPRNPSFTEIPMNYRTPSRVATLLALFSILVQLCAGTTAGAAPGAQNAKAAARPAKVSHALRDRLRRA